MLIYIIFRMRFGNGFPIYDIVFMHGGEIHEIEI
jgi:hypothetical protein